MGKTIYQLLNDVETDFSEYENAELTSGEKDHFKTKILMEVKNMKAEEKEQEELEKSSWCGSGICSCGRSGRNCSQSCIRKTDF